VAGGKALLSFILHRLFKVEESISGLKNEEKEVSLKIFTREINILY